MSLSLIESLYQIGSVKFGEFTLKSGQLSKIYLDLRQIVSYPEILREVAKGIWRSIPKATYDLICGVPYTALPIATCLSLEHNIPMIMRRKEKKSYGTKQQIEGKFHPGQTCLIIEDVITTGSSILETVEELKTVDIEVKQTALLIDRQQGGRKNLEKAGLEVYSVFTLKEILEKLSVSNQVKAEDRVIIDELLGTTSSLAGS